MSSSSSSSCPQKVKYRSTCDNCLKLKVKCSQQKPGCERCESLNVLCIYGISRRRGKPKRASSGPEPLSPQLQAINNNNPIISSHHRDSSVPSLDDSTDHMQTDEPHDDQVDLIHKNPHNMPTSNVDHNMSLAGLSNNPFEETLDDLLKRSMNSPLNMILPTADNVQFDSYGGEDSISFDLPYSPSPSFITTSGADVHTTAGQTSTTLEAQSLHPSLQKHSSYRGTCRMQDHSIPSDFIQLPPPQQHQRPDLHRNPHSSPSVLRNNRSSNPYYSLNPCGHNVSLLEKLQQVESALHDEKSPPNKFPTPMTSPWANTILSRCELQLPMQQPRPPASLTPERLLSLGSSVLPLRTLSEVLSCRSCCSKSSTLLILTSLTEYLADLYQLHLARQVYELQQQTQMQKSLHHQQPQHHPQLHQQQPHHPSQHHLHSISPTSTSTPRHHTNTTTTDPIRLGSYLLPDHEQSAVVRLLIKSHIKSFHQFVDALRAAISSGSFLAVEGQAAACGHVIECLGERLSGLAEVVRGLEECVECS